MTLEEGIMTLKSIMTLEGIMAFEEKIMSLKKG